MNETIMTVVGNVVDAPTMRRTKNGHLVANFRVASTSRRFDRDKGEWADSGTLFVTVTAWRSLAQNVGDSLKKGQPVLVMGRYYQREFTQNEVLRTTYELEATAVGHDLTRGVATFERVNRPSLATTVDLDDEGNPADLSASFLDLSDDDHDAAHHDAAHHDAAGHDGGPGPEIDLVTGEVRDLAAV